MQWTNTERSGHRAFLLIEGLGLFVIAPILTVVAALGVPFDESLAETFIKCAAFSGAEVGIISIPISFAWAVLSSIARDHRLRAAALARLLLVEFFVVALFVVFTNALGPLERESAVKWNLPVYGEFLVASSIFWLCATLVALPFAFLYRNRRRRANQVASTGGN